MNLLEGNLLDPLTFDQGEIGLFIMRHVCGLCGSMLAATFAPGNRYYAHCTIHGNLIESQIVSKHQQEQAVESRYIGRRELRQPSGKTPEEIIKELGF